MARDGNMKRIDEVLKENIVIAIIVNVSTGMDLLDMDIVTIIITTIISKIFTVNKNSVDDFPFYE